MRRLVWRLTVALVECLLVTALVIGPFLLRMLTSDRF
jgi:hypothetical protein